MIEQIAVAAIISLGPTLVGLATWRGIQRNATQESVDKIETDVLELHGCLNRHTIKDEANFRALDDRLDEALVHAEEVAATLATLTRETAADLAHTTEGTAEVLAEHDKAPEGYRTTP